MTGVIRLVYIAGVIDRRPSCSRLSNRAISALPTEYTDVRRIRALEVSKALTTTEVARLLSVSTRTVSKWCDTGVLPCYRRGRDRRVTREWLIKFLVDTKRIDQDTEAFLRKCVA